MSTRVSGTLHDVWRAVASADKRSVADAEVWWCTLPHLDDRELDEAVERGLLSRRERHDADRRLHARHRARYAARRIVRRLVAADHLGVPGADVSVTALCAHCGEDGHGRPEAVSQGTERLFMSTASVGDQAVVALSTRSLGVDMESPRRLDGMPPERLPTLVAGWQEVKSACPPDATVTQVWTAMEALVKTTGRGARGTRRQLDQAISGHRLVWFADRTGLVTCLARSA